MTNIRARGFDTQSQLQEYLAELEDDAPAEDGPTRDSEARAAEREIAALRSELADLRESWGMTQRQYEEAFKLGKVARPWLGIAAAITSVLALGIIAGRLQLL